MLAHFIDNDTTRAKCIAPLFNMLCLQGLEKKSQARSCPAFYADLPDTFEEICDSERRYIKAFLKHPFRTQCIYFYTAFVNIAIKGARSN